MRRRTTFLHQFALLSAVSCLATGCLVSTQKSEYATIERAQTSGLDGFRTTLYPYARKNCAECHGSGQSPLFAATDVHAAYQAALGDVNLVDIPSSTIMRKVKDGHCGGPCSGDGSEMLKLLTEWSASFADNAPGEEVPKGNIFTQTLPFPKPNPDQCQLPDDLKNSPDISGQNTCWTKLRYPLKDMKPGLPDELSRAWFEVDVSYENYASAQGPASYVIRNPRLISPDVPIYIFDIKIFINGKYHPEYGEAYQKVDTVVTPATFGTGCTVPPAPTPFDPNSIGDSCVPSVQPLYSTAASASGIVQESPNDTLSFSFEYLQKGIPGECKDLAMWQENVYQPIKIGAVACLNCHRSGGQISEAGQRFNMDIDDPNNGATADERLKTVCKRFLQRSNLALPDNSPIIVQPRQGLNGMPAQENFNYFAPNWISWIQQEAALAK